MNRREFLLTTTGGAIAAAAAQGALAAPGKEVTLGAIYPLSGSSAEVGIEARQAIETAVDVVNNKYDINLPLARSAGLPGLGGAKVNVIFADHQGDPEKGRAEAERLLTQNKVSTIIGAFHSAVSATVSVTCERYKVPYICADSSSPSLSQHGLKYFFRPSPTDQMFNAAMFDLLDALRKKGNRIESVALFHEDTIFGTDSARVQSQLAKERGYKVAADVKYHSNSPSLTSQVEQLKEANADVLMPSSYTTDLILLFKTMTELGYRPKGIIGFGFTDPALVEAVGKLLNGVVTRSSFSLDLGVKRPSILQVNKLFRARSGKDLSDNTSRQFMGLIVAADAINSAASIQGPKIREALVQMDIPGDQTIMPWRKIKFDATGQNTFADPVLLQDIGGAFRTIFPDRLAVAKPIWPLHGS